MSSASSASRWDVPYVSRAEMEESVPGLYLALPPQTRDLIPAGVMVRPKVTALIRNGFTFVQSYVDELFARVRYVEGEPWEMWKLLGVHALIWQRAGDKRAQAVGLTVFRTIPMVTASPSAEAALRGLDDAYHHDHNVTRSEPALWEAVGGFSVTDEAPRVQRFVDRTPYPAAMIDGMLTGIAAGFPSARMRFTVDATRPRKSAGARTTHYLVTYG